MINSIKTIALLFALVACGFAALGQKPKTKPASSAKEVNVGMKADNWEFPQGAAEFVDNRGVQSMKLTGATVTLKDVEFGDGTIEYDVEPQSDGFAGIYFHRIDEKESEYFYLRVARAGNPAAMDAIQYAPTVKGVLLWDVMDHYQGPVNMVKGAWNHVKLVMSGKQMLVYVNDITTPSLQVTRLEGTHSTGRIAFDGRCVIGNVVIKPNVVEGLSATEGYDPTFNDPRYIRSWQVTDPQPLPKGREVSDLDFPKASTTWTDLSTERRGLANLTRLFGKSDSRRVVWARARLVSNGEQKRKIKLGFSDEVWVYLNRQPVFVDKNIYTSAAMRKEPDGRISIENSEFEITLAAGENELLIAVANDFFGWGLMARLNSMQGITANIDFPPPVVLPKDLSPYTGTYTTKEAPEKIKFFADDNRVMCQPDGQQAIEIEYFDKDKFRYSPYGVVFEFEASGKAVVIRQGGSVRTYTRE